MSIADVNIKSVYKPDYSGYHQQFVLSDKYAVLSKRMPVQAICLRSHAVCAYALLKRAWISPSTKKLFSVKTYYSYTKTLSTTQQCIGSTSNTHLLQSTQVTNSSYINGSYITSLCILLQNRHLNTPLHLQLTMGQTIIHCAHIDGGLLLDEIKGFR